MNNKIPSRPPHLFCALLILITACGLFGQATPAKLEFEATSVRLSAPATPGVPRGPRTTGGPGTADPGRITIENYPLAGLIMDAYKIRLDQLSGPDWLVKDFGPFGVKVDITANVPAGTTKEQYLVMLQNLLAERFRITLHHDKKEMPVLELVVAKNGPKFKPSPVAATQPDDAPPAAPAPPKFGLGTDGYPELAPGRGMALIGDRGRMRAVNETMQEFAGWLSVQSGQTVTDGTGLKGNYDFGLYWVTRETAPTDLNAGPTLAQAVQYQLGLRLEPRKAPVDTLVIDHIEKVPTEN